MSNECPHCKSKLEVGDVPFLWLERYGDKCVATTSCCGHAVTITQTRVYKISAYTGTRDTDDWGAEIKPIANDNIEQLVLSVQDAMEAKMFFHAGKQIVTAKQPNELLVAVLAATTSPADITKLLAAVDSAKKES